MALHSAPSSAPSSYWQEPPGAALAPVVTRLSGSADRGAPAHPVRVLPDGGVDLLFTFGADGGGVAAEVFGVKSRALTVHDRRPREKLAVHLRPGACVRLLGVPAWELRDRAVALEELRPEAGRLHEQLAEADTWADRSRAVRANLAAWVGGDAIRSSAARVDRAVAAIDARGGRLPIRTLAREIGTTPRSLERLFLEHLGLPPKVYARLVRFRAALRALERGRTGTATALASGYSDQAHMIREVRAFAGVAPGQLGRAPDTGERPPNA